MSSKCMTYFISDDDAWLALLLVELIISLSLGLITDNE